MRSIRQAVRRRLWARDWNRGRYWGVGAFAALFAVAQFLPAAWPVCFGVVALSGVAYRSVRVAAIAAGFLGLCTGIFFLIGALGRATGARLD